MRVSLSLPFVVNSLEIIHAVACFLITGKSRYQTITGHYPYVAN